MPAKCPKCGCDMSLMSDDEGMVHAQFHEHMKTWVGSFPSQDNPRTLSNFYGFQDDPHVDRSGWSRFWSAR